jgi:single-strand DNA-binding protein
MNETLVTLQGWLGGEVTTRQAGDSVVANFRVATTPRRYQKKSDTWVDGATQWYTVNAWRALAENCGRSLRRGDPVVVHGKLNAQVWTNSAGIEVASFEVEASFVGHDLNRGTSEFSRNVRALTEPDGPGETDEPVGEAPDGPVATAPAA